MLDVFVCCSPADREVALAIAGRLERGAEARVVLDENADRTVAARWDEGQACSAILLILSPDSVPARLNRAEWEAMLEHATGYSDPPLACLVVRDCAYPRLLERKNFFRWEQEPKRVLRAIERWIVSLHTLPEQPAFVPARLPWFESRQPEWDLLWETLVDDARTAILFNSESASGKTCLAQEFARQADAHFRDVVWIACGDRGQDSILGDLARQLGAPLRGPAEEASASLAQVAAQHRLLVVFDDVVGSPPLPPLDGGFASTLITTRSAGLTLPTQAVAIAKETITPQALQLPASRVDLALWQAMAVCRPQGFPLELAASIAGIGIDEARTACRRLIDGRLVDAFDHAGKHMRLGAHSLAAACSTADLEPQRRRHAKELQTLFSGWAKEPGHCNGYVAEMESALRWALDADWATAVELGRSAFAFLRHQDRTAEGCHVLEQLREAADLRQDSDISEYCSWELSWMSNSPYGGTRAGTIAGEQLALDFT